MSSRHRVWPGPEPPLCGRVKLPEERQSPSRCHAGGGKRGREEGKLGQVCLPVLCESGAPANTCAHTLTCAYMLLGLAYSLGPPPKCALRQHPTDSPQTKDPEESHFQEGLSCPTRSEISALPASAGCPVHHPCQPAPPIWRAKGCGPRGSGLFPSLPFPPWADLSGCECPAHLGWELQQRALGSVANKPRTWASGRLRRSPQPGAPRTLAGKPSCLCCDRSVHA